jgi:MFS family permease
VCVPGRFFGFQAWQRSRVYHLTDHGHDLEFVGIVISMHVAGMFVPSPISGWLADRIGPLTVAALGFALLASFGFAGVVVDEGSGMTMSALLVLLGLG